MPPLPFPPDTQLTHSLHYAQVYNQSRSQGSRSSWSVGSGYEIGVQSFDNRRSVYG